MALRLSALGVGHIGGTILFFTGLGIYTAYGHLNHALNYTQVPATITGVTQTCAFDHESTLYSGETRWIPCGAMSEASSAELKAQHMLLKHDIAFTFVSPADHKQHEGVFTLMNNTMESARLHAQTIKAVWAHDSDPAIYERL